MDALKNKELRRFGLMVGGVFLALGLLPTLVYGSPPRAWCLILGGALIVPALLLPKLLSPAHRGWMALAHGMGWVNTKFLLGLTFFLLFVPMGFAMRLLRRDPMRRTFDKAGATYRVVREPRPASHMTHQF